MSYRVIIQEANASDRVELVDTLEHARAFIAGLKPSDYDFDYGYITVLEVAREVDVYALMREPATEHLRSYLSQPDKQGNIPTGELDANDVSEGGDGKVFES